VVIDVATLTGACVTALGGKYAGIFSTSEALTKRLQEQGKRAGEHSWPLPLAEEYRSQIDSPVADLKNIGSRSGGAITAALFLKEFVPEDASWAHLDIAGPAFSESPGSYCPKGGTGFGVRTLIGYLESL